MATKTTIVYVKSSGKYSPTPACPILNGNSSRPADLQIYRDIKARPDAGAAW